MFLFWVSTLLFYRHDVQRVVMRQSVQEKQSEADAFQSWKNKMQGQGSLPRSSVELEQEHAALQHQRDVEEAHAHEQDQQDQAEQAEQEETQEQEDAAEQGKA
eukprot:CAMPEP_0175164076 /NCGR_PEP_ID=MMETSP0087-20121206/26171_1 /TAXON_ID=136419 /ORGANISM="Unknown Unknown, Strain D1" /LENGTH=102 /DNA_ID=CAMNT_0016452985 /DNA_START=31 /DNA_END=335 /DNA_ORIENTATION=+